jgi:uncharacterized protein
VEEKMPEEHRSASMQDEQSLDRIIHMVEEIVRPMLAFPEELRCEVGTVGDIHVLRLVLSPEDLPKVTGREGRIAESLQAVVSALSVRFSQEIYLEIIASE